MKNESFHDRLTPLPVPEPDATAYSRALSRALMALEHREVNALIRQRHPLLWSLPMGCALAIALLLVALPGDPFGRSDLLLDLVVLDEMSALFDHRLEAVVEHDGEMDVQLSPQEQAPSQQPIRLVLSRGREVVRVLSFSGREVCLSINGEKTCLQILATKDGEVIITGGNFIWIREHPALRAGYRIEAMVLTPTS